MKKLSKAEPLVPLFLTGKTMMTVVSLHSNSTLTVSDCESDYLATVAYSCLIKPEQGDQVLIEEIESIGLVVTDIVQRKSSQPANLTVAGDLVIQSLKGNIRLTAKEGIDLLAPSVSVLTSKFIQKAKQATLDISNMVFKGDKIKAKWKQSFILADLMNTFSKLSINKHENHIRNSSQSDEVKAGTLAHRANGVYSVRSEHSILVSEKDTKIDGEHIHMG